MGRAPAWAPVVGCGLGTMFGIVAGFTGWMQMPEYKTAAPWNHAIMLGFSFGWFGLVLGAVAGLLIWMCIWTWKRMKGKRNS
jgi:hypothetical protein